LPLTRVRSRGNPSAGVAADRRAGFFAALGVVGGPGCALCDADPARLVVTPDSFGTKNAWVLK